MASFWQRVSMAVTAFREGYVTSDLLDNEEFEDFSARKLRYQILWAMYENTLYRDIHNWASAYRNQYSLYKAIRNIYNPTYRAVEFWKMIVWGGFLDEEAEEEGSIPIKTESKEVRTALAKLWYDSNWATQKDILVGWGASLGDTAIKIVDDVARKEVRIEPVHPGLIKELEFDDKGDVVRYVFEEVRVKEFPNDTKREVVFREEAELDNETVHYSTYVDEAPAGWDGQPAEWQEKYGFVPLVPIQHLNVGRPWGWAELHAGRSKVNEIDDLASKLHDYIRKIIDPVWLMNFKQPKNDSDMEAQTSSRTTNRPDPVREEMPAIYVPNPNAKAQALVTDQIDIEHVAGEIQNVLAELERDYPELQMDIWTVGGYTTGSAMKSARQKVERKVAQRRPNYDKALVKAHKMAMVIGNQRSYEGYTSFGTELDDESMKHIIPIDREIFEADAQEEIDKKKKFWDVFIDVMTKARGQIPPEMVLKDFGWSEDKITEYMASYEEWKTKVESEMDKELENEEEEIDGNGQREGRTGSGRTGESEDDRSRYRGERGPGRGD